MSRLFLQYAFSAVARSKHVVSTIFSQAGETSICHNNKCLVPGFLWLNSYNASKAKWPCLALCTISGSSLQEASHWSKWSKLLAARDDQM